jgi:hypothetical protein
MFGNTNLGLPRFEYTLQLLLAMFLKFWAPSSRIPIRAVGTCIIAVARQLYRQHGKRPGYKPMAEHNRIHEKETQERAHSRQCIPPPGCTIYR